MVHSHSKISSLCRKYGLWAGRPNMGCGVVVVWGGRAHMGIVGLIRVSDDWGEIEGNVVEWAMLDSFEV